VNRKYAIRCSGVKVRRGGNSLIVCIKYLADRDFERDGTRCRFHAFLRTNKQGVAQFVTQALQRFADGGLRDSQTVRRERKTMELAYFVENDEESQVEVR
jgi:hypothetical protein